jgi:hypothetical protein
MLLAIAIAMTVIASMRMRPPSTCMQSSGDTHFVSYLQLGTTTTSHLHRGSDQGMYGTRVRPVRWTNNDT